MTDPATDIAGAPGTTVLPTRERWLATVVVMAAMVMVVLDTTIANVAIPHMQAALGATSESVAWVLTSYIVATAIAIPVTGWLADKIGRRLLFTIAIAGFTASSALCGAAQSLEMMIAARVLQGVFGAFIGPLSQATLYDVNPPEKHAQAMTVWGTAVMAAPVLGPVLGGWLTETYDWRWVFYVNVPIGVAAALGTFALVPDWRGKLRRFDLFGYLLLAVALGALQLMLDRGTQLDWFESTEIRIEAALLAGAAWMFVIHVLGKRDPIVPLEIFRDRNFLTSLMFVSLLGAIVMAGAALVAPMMQRLMNYPVLQAGLAIAPRGIGTLIGFLGAGWLIHRIDPRVIVVCGLMLVIVSLHMMTGFTLDMGTASFLWSGLVQGAGVGMVMMPVNLLAFVTLPARLRTDAASFYNLCRNIGGAVSISVATALLAGNIQLNHAEIGARLNAPVLQSGMAETVGVDSAVLWGMIDGEVNRQAAMIAYLDDFWLMMWLTIICAPLVLLMAKPQDLRSPVHVME